MIESRFLEHIVGELGLSAPQVAAVIELHDSGATLPFIAHYRKDATGGLDEDEIEQIIDRNNYYIGVTNRRNAIIENLEKAGKLTDEVRQRVEQSFDKTELEDLYIPFKTRRANRATMSEEQGLGPLADFIARQLPLSDVEGYANAFVKPEKGISSTQEAFEGALYILVERYSLDSRARAELRRRLMEEGKITARPTKNAEGKKTKYESYYEFSEPVREIPSHRLLAILRGVKEGFLRVDISIDDEKALEAVMAFFVAGNGSLFEPYVRLAVQEAYSRHLRLAMESEVMDMLRKRADEGAIAVFRENAENLLLAAPVGPAPMVGAVPGADGTARFVAIAADGTFAEHQTFFLPAEGEDTTEAETALLAFMQRHGANAIAMSNAQGSAALTRFAKSVLAKLGNEDAFAVSVSGSPSAAYASSKPGRDEMPDVEPDLREAVSITRRVQNPLTELVKVEPRSIGVGQYQHDVNQKELREGLQRSISSCVNKVGVNPNTASAALLRYVSGIQAGTADHIVSARERLGSFKSRAELLNVDGIGPRVFEQCAGFMRILGGENPLDATSIHPEHYGLVAQMAESVGTTVAGLLGDKATVEKIDFQAFQCEGAGPLTLAAIRDALLAPQQDPRPRFKAPKLVEGISSIQDLQEGAELEGVVTNVTNFGAFVDVGVQQDGLVHLSELSNHFVKDPREIVNVGDVVRIKVLAVDKQQPRISLSMKALQPPRPKRAPRRRAQATSGEAAPVAPAQAEARPDDARRRPRREGAPQRPERPDGAKGSQGSRPAREDRRDRPQGGRGDRDARRSDGDKRAPRPRRDDRTPSHQQGHAAQSSGGESRINTLLADQLAALREKLGSGK